MPTTALPEVATKPPRSGRIFTFDGWLKQILPWLASVGLFVGMAAILKSVNGQPVPEWRIGAHGLSLNALVALLATLDKVSLMMPVSDCLGQLKWNWHSGRGKSVRDFETFDKASRGEWGSICFLLHPRK